MKCGILRYSLALAAGCCVSLAHAQVTIIGGLSNFDVHNETETECNEFDIEIEGPQIEDVFHTYHNGNYGPPTITRNAAHTGILVVYKNPQHPTSMHGLEHFGVSLRSLNQMSHPKFTWKHGLIVPPPPPPLPTVTEAITWDSGEQMLTQSVTNIDTHGQYLWIKRTSTSAARDREVNLEELMTDDPLVTGSDSLDLAPILVAPGQSLSTTEAVSDVIEGSTVLSYEVFLNNRVWTGSYYQNRIGNPLGTVMNASVLEFVCVGAQPTITVQPVSTSAPFDGRATFSAEAVGDTATFGTINYQWRHEGVDMRGEDQPTLSIDPITPTDAGAYTCVIRNDCSRIDTRAAYLTVVMPQAPCVADFNQDGGVDGADIEAFFIDWEASGNRADVNQDGGVDGADIEAFFGQWTAGGC
jgi:hypothetical protein